MFINTLDDNNGNTTTDDLGHPLIHDAGNPTSETIGGVTTLYLTDTQNPTGYDKPIEERNYATGKPIMTFILGDRVLGQVDAAGNVTYLLSDGHGSTRILMSAAGAVTAAFNYDAFGTALNFNAGMAATPFLYGGDSMFDAPSGLYFHGNGVRTRLGFIFMQRDFGRTGQGNRQDPLSLHKYLYASGNPVTNSDPTGHDDLDLTQGFGIFSAWGLAVIPPSYLSGTSVLGSITVGAAAAEELAGEIVGAYSLILHPVDAIGFLIIGEVAATGFEISIDGPARALAPIAGVRPDWKTGWEAVWDAFLQYWNAEY